MAVGCCRPRVSVDQTPWHNILLVSLHALPPLLNVDNGMCSYGDFKIVVRVMMLYSEEHFLPEVCLAMTISKPQVSFMPRSAALKAGLLGAGKG